MERAGSKQSAAILEIMAEVERIDAAPHTKYALKKFINAICLAAGIKVVDRKERVKFARRLLDDGEPRPVIRDRLIARFGIEKTSAYDAICSALKLSGKSAKCRKIEAQNSITGSTATTQD